MDKKNEILVDVKNVSKVYYDTEGNKVEALKDVSLQIKKGEFISFIGASGCGKTTLLRLISGLDSQHYDGGLFIEGEKITAPSCEVGFVFQQAALFPWKTIEENIAVGLRARKVYGEKKDEVEKYISMISLDGFEKSYPHEVSGGMAQRVAIARALINEPKILLMDEPLGALDAFTRIDLQNMILNIWEKTHITIALVTHDVDEAIILSDRIVIMTPRPGKISEIINVSIPHNRDRNDNEFLLIRKQILEKLHIAARKQLPEYNI
ncbi:MAG: ABC transporter ATP-binding protein [Elusimicrobiota bacterium]|jgi:ABC-type nitrate/sulfonate/bicarbonate transport system ATPase subunit|nr:ABC transporter ATP-binding protein [Elusimicrobiota bacterium]